MPLYTSTKCLALVSVVSLSSAAGIPIVVSPGLNVSTNPNVTAQAPCYNLSSAPQPNCYTTLKVNAYLENYDSIKAETCAPGELWSTCFLRTIYEVPGVNCTRSNRTSCTPFDCSKLSSSGTCPPPVVGNSTNATLPTQPAAWYAAWNIYNLHDHITSWATALSANTSQNAIVHTVNPQTPNTPSQLLIALLTKYGFNPNADQAIVKLLQIPTNGTEIAYGNSRLRGELSTPSGSEWQPVLSQRLGQVLALAMGNATAFEGAVTGGVYSVRGLAGTERLVGSLSKG